MHASPFVNQRVTVALIIFVGFTPCVTWAFSGRRWTRHQASRWFRQLIYNE